MHLQGRPYGQDMVHMKTRMISLFFSNHSNPACLLLKRWYPEAESSLIQIRYLRKQAPVMSDHTANPETHKGTDDVLAHLLAFSARPEEIEVLLVSVTFGNVDVQLSAPRSSPSPPSLFCPTYTSIHTR